MLLGVVATFICINTSCFLLLFKLLDPHLPLMIFRAFRDFENCTFYYRPQRSFEGYVFTPVCLSTRGGGVRLSACLDTTPSPQQTVTVADGTHPTGMHSCSQISLQYFMIITMINFILLCKYYIDCWATGPKF